MARAALLVAINMMAALATASAAVNSNHNVPWSEVRNQGYGPFCIGNHDRHVAKVFLDGIEQLGAISFDTKRGAIRRFRMLGDGSVAHENGLVQTEIVHGRVVIETCPGQK